MFIQSENTRNVFLTFMNFILFWRLLKVQLEIVICGVRGVECIFPKNYNLLQEIIIQLCKRNSKYSFTYFYGIRIVVSQLYHFLTVMSQRLAVVAVGWVILSLKLQCCRFYFASPKNWNVSSCNKNCYRYFHISWILINRPERLINNLSTSAVKAFELIAFPPHPPSHLNIFP